MLCVSLPNLIHYDRIISCRLYFGSRLLCFGLISVAYSVSAALSSNYPLVLFASTKTPHGWTG